MKLHLCASTTTLLTLALLVPCAYAQDPKPGPKSAKPAPKPQPPPTTDPAMDDAPDQAPDKTPPEEPARLPTTAVIASRTTRPTLRTPRALTLIGREELDARGGQVLVNALHERMGLWVEHRTGTTGDVVMRGLSGGNILSLIDGCSLSTFWGEGGFAGDDMYGKIDPDSIERIEIVRGPASVMYGSQALGGVINFISREAPFDFTESGARAGIMQKIRVSSADVGIRSRTEAIFASPLMRGYIAFSAADMNNIEGGRGIGVQENTSGREWNTDGKIEFLPAEAHLFTFTFRDINRRNLRRYYRPTQDNQNDFTSVMGRWRLEQPWGGMHEAQAHVHYQKKTDRRFWENDPNGRMGEARTETWTAALQGSWHLGGENNTVTVGLDTHLDVGESADDEQFTERRNSWAVGPPGERMAGPSTQWWNIGLFAHDVWDIGPLTAEASARVDYVEFATDPFSSRYYPASYTGAGSLEAAQAPDDMRDGSFALTGGLGLSWEMIDNVALFVNGSRGYRQWAPRFGFSQIGPGILAPSPDLPDPVISYSAEIGLKADSGKLSGEMVGYYTRFNGMLVDERGTFQGQDWFDWDGDGIRDPNEDLFVRKSEGKAWVTGFEVESVYRFDGDLKSLGWAGNGWWDGLSLRSGFMWNYGKDHNFSNDNLRHAHPARAVVALRWDEPELERFWGEVSVDAVRFFHRVPDSRLQNDPGYKEDPADPSSNLQREDGLPGYTTLAVRTGFKWTDRLDITFGVANIGNKRYRRAHSRIRAETGITAFLSSRLLIG